MRTRKRPVPARPELSRRALLAGGVGAGALIALPDLGLRAATTSGTGTTGAGPAAGGTRYALVYGTTEAAPSPGGSLATSAAPAPAASGAVKPAVLPAAVPVASTLAAAPVASPDQATTALVTIDPVSGGQRVTLTLVDMSTLALVKQNSITVTGIPDGTNILVTPVFAPGTTVIPVVLAITVPKPAGQMSKTDLTTGRPATWPAVSYQSQHALAWFDTATGAFDGPHYLGDEGTLALTTVAANKADLFVMTTREPRPAVTGTKAPVSQLHAFPLGTAKARFTAPAFGPWPGGEPVVTLASGDVARMVNGRAVQVFSAKNGDATQHTIAPLNVIRAKPSAITMQARPDGTVFLTKPGIGKAVIADPAHGFRTTAEVTFPVPAKPLGAPWSKAVLSADAGTMYVAGAAKTGGVASYDVRTGALAGAFSQGHQYAGVFAMPSGSLLAVSAANPRLTFFSPGLSPLGTASTDLQVADAF
jgi:hypothetical protein